MGPGRHGKMWDFRQSSIHNYVLVPVYRNTSASKRQSIYIPFVYRYEFLDNFSVTRGPNRPHVIPRLRRRGGLWYWEHCSYQMSSTPNFAGCSPQQYASVLATFGGDASLTMALCTSLASYNSPNTDAETALSGLAGLTYGECSELWFSGGGLIRPPFHALRRGHRLASLFRGPRVHNAR